MRRAGTITPRFRQGERLAFVLAGGAALAACATPEQLAEYRQEQADEEARRERARAVIAEALEDGRCRYRQQTGSRTDRVLQCEPGVLRPGDPDETERSLQDWQHDGALCTASDNRLCGG